LWIPRALRGREPVRRWSRAGLPGSAASGACASLRRLSTSSCSRRRWASSVQPPFLAGADYRAGCSGSHHGGRRRVRRPPTCGAGVGFRGWARPGLLTSLVCPRLTQAGADALGFGCSWGRCVCAERGMAATPAAGRLVAFVGRVGVRPRRRSLVRWGHGRAWRHLGTEGRHYRPIRGQTADQRRLSLAPSRLTPRMRQRRAQAIQPPRRRPP